MCDSLKDFNTVCSAPVKIVLVFLLPYVHNVTHLQDVQK